MPALHTQLRRRRVKSGAMNEIGTAQFPRTKRFDMEERKTQVFNAKQRTIGVSQPGYFRGD
jgi:hypothetical protein